MSNRTLINLISTFSGKLADLLVLSNKAPVWSYENQSYVLNFHGRVTRVRLLLISSTLDLQSISVQASVKNFQMEIEPDNVIMQFGRVGTDTFTMDFRWVVDINKPLLMANIHVAFFVSINCLYFLHYCEKSDSSSNIFCIIQLLTTEL